MEGQGMNRDGAKITIVGGRQNKSDLISLQELLEFRFIIPIYQRPYAWDETHFRDLLETVEDTKNKDRSASALFGSIIVALKQGDESAQPGKQKYFIIDGQQRVTSFLVLLKFLREALDKSEKKLSKKL